MIISFCLCKFVLEYDPHHTDSKMKQSINLSSEVIFRLGFSFCYVHSIDSLITECLFSSQRYKFADFFSNRCLHYDNLFQLCFSTLVLIFDISQFLYKSSMYAFLCVIRNTMNKWAPLLEMFVILAIRTITTSSLFA